MTQALSAGEARRVRLQSLRDGALVLGPHTVHIDVTNACNTDCVTCWDHSPHLDDARPAAWKRQRVDPDQVRALLDDIQALGGLEALIVSGMGEPFTHPRIYEMLDDLRARGLHITVITNLVAADVERIAGVVDVLLVGVHGATEQSYLAFHPSFRAGEHWPRLHGQLERLRAGGRVKQKHVQVICRTNAHELVAMIEQAARLEAQSVSFKLASLHHGTEAVRVTRAQRARLLRTDVEAARRRAGELGVAHNLDVFVQQLEAGGEVTAPIADIGCFIGTSYARITVDGTVLFCCNTEMVVGSLRDGPFSMHWRGPRWAALRAQMQRGDYLASCDFCGKLNQNEKLSRRFKELFGEDAWRAQSGHRAPKPRRLRVLP